MTIQQHKRAVDLALRAGNELKSLFDKMGHGEAPRGRILRAYRNARAALTNNVDNRFAVDEALQELRLSAITGMAELMRSAQALGVSQAERQLEIYGVLPLTTVDLATELEAAGAAWVARLDAQLAGARSLALTGSDEALILGDAARAGVLTPGPILNEGARWIAQLTGGAFIGIVTQSSRASGFEFYKQAIAAIDERTTDCCLRVNGQAVPLDKPFKLTGEPRYADQLESPPFHWWCRTAEALVPADEVDDTVSAEMRQAGRAELKARDASRGSRKEIHPADARSRRT